MTSVAFSVTPSPLAFAENSMLMVLRSCVAKGMASWSFPATNRAAVEELQAKGLVDAELEKGGQAYRVMLTEAGKEKLGV